MAKVELSILRLGVCELRFMDGEIPPSITINECVELAKRYSSDKSAKFVNGVLAAVLTAQEAALK
jgi:N utilization substance protein B